MDSRQKRKQAFTLIEVLLVIVILAMLAGVGIGVYFNYLEGSKVDTTKLLIEEVVKAVEGYAMHVGHAPTEEEGGLKALLTKPQFEDEKQAEKWRGPYVRREPKDSWGNALNYEVVESGSEEGVNVPFKIWSNGKDGQSGTEDDIKNWSDEESS